MARHARPEAVERGAVQPLPRHAAEAPLSTPWWRVAEPVEGRNGTANGDTGGPSRHLSEMATSLSVPPSLVPAETDPVVAEPVVAEAVGAEPVVAEAVGAEPVVAEAADSEPETAESPASEDGDSTGPLYLRMLVPPNAPAAPAVDLDTTMVFARPVFAPGELEAEVIHPDVLDPLVPHHLDAAALSTVAPGDTVDADVIDTDAFEAAEAPSVGAMDTRDEVAAATTETDDPPIWRPARPRSLTEPTATPRVLPSPGPSPRVRPRRRRRRRAPLPSWAVWAVMLSVAILLAVGIRTFLLQSFWIPSSSMEPTLHGCSGCNNDHVLVAKLAYRLHPIHRGDVVVFSRPPALAATDEDKYLIKRVIGLPGDVVSGHDGRVWIGNQALTESYVNPACAGTATFPAETVPANMIFVMGDNRCGSLDSRSFGPISESSVVGRAFVIVWPLGRLHWL